jgi:predicted HicB family RNase H-like nuclease
VKTLDEVEKYTYRVIWSEEDQEHVGLCAEFPSLSWLDRSQTGALRGIVDVVRHTVEDMLKAHEPIPEPIATRRYSGQFKVRIPPEVHRRLSIEAAESKVSLNRLVSAKLAHG